MNRRGFLLAASGLLVPQEPLVKRAWWFLGGTSPNFGQITITTGPALPFQVSTWHGDYLFLPARPASTIIGLSGVPTAKWAKFFGLGDNSELYEKWSEASRLSASTTGDA